MADWHDLKKAFERDLIKEEKKFIANEQKLLKDIAKYLGSQKGMTAVQVYRPEEVLEFLEKPVSEIKNCIGQEWIDVENSQLEVLIYSLTKKVIKSDSLTTW